MDQAICPTSDTSPCKNQRHKRICGRGGIGRLGGFRFLCESVQVRVLSPAPNKHDSFDTKVSETIVLFLFAKAPVTQGFSAQLPFELVSL